MGTALEKVEKPWFKVTRLSAVEEFNLSICFTFVCLLSCYWVSKGIWALFAFGTAKAVWFLFCLSWFSLSLKCFGLLSFGLCLLTLLKHNSVWLLLILLIPCQAFSLGISEAPVNPPPPFPHPPQPLLHHTQKCGGVKGNIPDRQQLHAEKQQIYPVPGADA